MLLSCCYKHPKGIMENLTDCLTSIFQRVQNEKKKSFTIGNFNLNCLNYKWRQQHKTFLPQYVWAWVYSSHQQAYKCL